MTFLCIGVFAALLIYHAESIAIDNGVKEVTVDCGEEFIDVDVESNKETLDDGRLFVKGRSEQPACRQSLRLGSTRHSFRIPVGSCGMERIGLASQGTSYYVTMIVSFHAMFITKVDRAFRIMCNYGGTKNGVVTNQFDVSMIPTTVLDRTVGTLSCTYTIHRSDENGPIMRYAAVGEKVAHVWRCTSLGPQQFLLVHSCTVKSDQGKQVQIIDEKGCGLDAVVLGNPEYRSNAVVVATHHAYKFADVPGLNFQCQISICRTGAGGDSGVCPTDTFPPNCPSIGGQSLPAIDVPSLSAGSLGRDSYIDQFTPSSVNFTTDELNSTTSNFTIATTPIVPPQRFQRFYRYRSNRLLKREIQDQQDSFKQLAIDDSVFTVDHVLDTEELLFDIAAESLNVLEVQMNDPVEISDGINKNHIAALKSLDSNPIDPSDSTVHFRKSPSNQFCVPHTRFLFGAGLIAISLGIELFIASSFLWMSRKSICRKL